MSNFGEIHGKIDASTKAADDAAAALGGGLGALDDAIGHLTGAIEDTVHDGVKGALTQLVEGREKLDEALALISAARDQVAEFRKVA